MLTLKLMSIALLSYLSIKLVQKQAVRLDFLDLPNERSQHVEVLPRGAGVGFVFAFFIGCLICYPSVFLIDRWMFVSILIVFIAGIIDDHHGISARFKFFTIFLAVYILWMDNYSIYTLGTWFGHRIDLPWWIALPFGMFAIAGLTNALNLIDGLDGLAGGVSIVIFCTFWFIGLKHHDHSIVMISSVMLFSLCGFMLLNWNPAKIFMGDSGSLTLGFVISILSMLSIHYIPPVVTLYLGALPVLDTLIVMVRRYRRGKSPFHADKTHMHHILVRFFENNVKKTVLFLIILQTIFSTSGYILIGVIQHDTTGWVPFGAFVGFGLIFVLFYMIFTGIQKRQLAVDKMNKINLP
ncbi:glycosyltransferase family 4 protein [Sulfurospirillum sp. 1612]|uniref:glycosyltransferase family 4 protein n=1 Tax=Sulfurospirillum sp. 1612 TaxID=3094835 RepID=UPI002F9547D0